MPHVWGCARHLSASQHGTRWRNTVVAFGAPLLLDCMQELRLPTFAVQIAVEVHLYVERWAAWGAWTMAADAVLTLYADAYALPDRIRLLRHRNIVACDIGDMGTVTLVAAEVMHLAGAVGDPTLIALPAPT